MSRPPLVGARAVEVTAALRGDRVIALPGDGGYQLAARHGGGGVAALVALVAARAAGSSEVVPYFAIGRLAQAGQVTSAWSRYARRVAIRFWPGPLVMIIGEGDATVRLTMPGRRWVRRLCRKSGPLVMATSCGEDGLLLTDPEAVRIHFTEYEVALVVDGGVLTGLGPSLLDCRESPPVVRQEGALPQAYIEAALLMGEGRPRWRTR